MHASLAENATAHHGRGSDPFQGFGSDPDEIERQSACLVEWATQSNAVLADSYTSGLERQEGAANPNFPHPSPAEIKEFMESLGFAEVKDSYFGWFKTGGNIKVIDARPDNFIKTANGVIPIDLVISERD